MLEIYIYSRSQADTQVNRWILELNLRHTVSLSFFLVIQLLSESNELSTTDPRKPQNVRQGSLRLDLYQFGQAVCTLFSVNIILPLKSHIHL